VAREPEATCLGAGILAAYGAGHFHSVEAAAAAMTGVGKTYEPQPAQSAKYDKLYGLYKDIYPALREHFQRLRQVMAEIA
jgi:xylulokinase